MKTNNYFEKIERYLEPSLGSEEKNALAKEIAQDKLLQEELAIQQIAKQVVETDIENDLRSQMRNLEAKSSASGKKLKTLPMRRVLSIAAAFLILVVAAWFIFSQTSTAGSAFQYAFSPMEDSLSPSIASELEETGFGNVTEELKQIQEGLNAYNSKDYSLAIAKLSPTATQSNYWQKDKIQLYLAISYLGEKNATSAIPLLEPLQNKAQFEEKIDAQWYLALAYLKNENLEKAIPILENLKGHSTYGTKVQKVLERL